MLLNIFGIGLPHAPMWVAFPLMTISIALEMLLLSLYQNTNNHREIMMIIWISLVCVPFSWIAFGPGTRECSARMHGGWSLENGLACRIPFGLAIVSLTALSFLAVVRKKS